MKILTIIWWIPRDRVGTYWKNCQQTLKDKTSIVTVVLSTFLINITLRSRLLYLSLMWQTIFVYCIYIDMSTSEYHSVPNSLIRTSMFYSILQDMCFCFVFWLTLKCYRKWLRSYKWFLSHPLQSIWWTPYFVPPYLSKLQSLADAIFFQFLDIF